MSEARQQPAVSVLLPAYHLPDVIEANISRVLRALDGIESVEVVVCDDGSGDGTREAIDRVAMKHPNVLGIHHDVNLGKGAAIGTAFAASRGETVVFLDGDMDLPPEQLPPLLDQFATTGLDGLVGAKARAMESGTYSPLRRLLSWIFSLSIRVLFSLPLHETQTGLKIFRRTPLDEILPGLETRRYTYDIELLAKMHAAGFRLANVPVRLAPAASTTALTPRTLMEMARDTLLIRWRLRKWRAARARSSGGGRT